ncbi:MAG: hypothetical protein ABSE73_22050 [Planctomycetota bacterium]
MRRLRKQAMWFGAVTVLLGGIAYGSTNLADNPNQVRWKFSPEMESPHIAWAKPLAGGPATATIIAPWYTYRDAVELCLRLAITVNPLMTDGFNQVPNTQQYDCAYPDLGDKPEVWLALAREQLKKKADVIVVGKVAWMALQGKVPAGGWEGDKWDALTVDLRPAIVEKVKGGCGLLYINPYLEKGNDGEVCMYLPLGDAPAAEKGKPWKVPATGEKVVLKRVEASDSLLRGLTGLKLPQLEGKEWSDLVYTGTLGNGRVLAVDYSFRTGFGQRSEDQFRDLTYGNDGGFSSSVHHCLVGAAPAPGMACSYEYLMSFTARSVLWCAGREPAARIESIAADAVGGVAVTAPRTPPSARLCVELRDCSGGAGEVVAKWDAAERPLKLPALKGGTYFVNAWLKNGKGEVLDWASARLDIQAAAQEERHLAEIRTAEAAPAPGAPLAGEIRLAGTWKEGELLRLAAVDNFGRCLWRSQWPSPGAQVRFRMSFDPGRSVAAVLKAERLRGGETLEALEKTVCFSTPELDGDFALILWASAVNYEDRTCRQNLALCRKLGVDALMHLPAELREPCLRSNMRLAHYVLRVVPVQVRGFSDPQNIEWWRNYFRSTARELAPLAPLLFTFGDETQGGEPASYLTPPFSDLDFRGYLGWVQDERNGHLDLAALNRSWGAGFKTPDDIQVRSLAELRKTNSRPQWVAESLWAEWTFQRLLRESMEAAWHAAPWAYYGDEGVGNLYGEWHDYYRLHRDMTVCQLYDSTHAPGPLFIKSFAHPKSLRGMWTGNYGYYLGPVDEQWMRSRPWRSLFYGMNSEWWWMLSLSVRPDGKPIPALAQYAEEIARIKAGPATLLLKAAQPSAPQVGVLYSPSTLHVSAFNADGVQPHPWALNTAAQALARTGYAVQALHQSQLDDFAVLGSGYKALMLPAVNALSEKQAAAIRRFVEEGGLLIADCLPEQYFSDLGLPYAKDPFRSVFTKGIGDIEYTFGKGKALLVPGALSLNLLERYKDTLGQSYSERQGKPLPLILRQWIEGATGCRPPVNVALPDGTPLADGEINTFQDGAALYVGIERRGRYWEGERRRWLTWDGYQEEVDATLAFPTAAHVYDVTRGEYVGQGPAVKVKLTSCPRLFAALPSKVEQLAVEGLAGSYRQGETIRAVVTLQPEREAGCQAVVHVSVLNAAGEMLPWFERNVIVAGGRGVIALPLALDEAPGNYRLVLRDVATGVTRTMPLAIQ